MTRAKRNILILGAGITAIVLMIVLLFLPLSKKASTLVGKENKSEAVLPSAPTVSSAELSPEAKKAVAAKINLELEVRRLAQLFIERYGSFSNQGNYENISDLYPLMTANMRRVSSSYEDEQKRTHPEGGAYYGVTTKAMGAEVVSLTETRATIKVNTQKQETFGTALNSVVIYQSATVSLARLGDTWKVDDVDWEAVK